MRARIVSSLTAGVAAGGVGAAVSAAVRTGAGFAGGVAALLVGTGVSAVGCGADGGGFDGVGAGDRVGTERGVDGVDEASWTGAAAGAVPFVGTDGVCGSGVAGRGLAFAVSAAVSAGAAGTGCTTACGGAKATPA